MENNSKKVIAAFDFDGTITTKDTLFHFIKYSFGWLKFIIGLIIFVPTFVSNLLKKITNSEAKEALFAIFFKNMTIEKFDELCNSYQLNISQILNKQAIEKINWHKSQGHQLIIVSASIENWIAPWALSYGFERVIATKIEVKNNKLTGRFFTKNCNNIEKVNRLMDEFPERHTYVLYAYGDTTGDAELLELADFPFFKTF